MGKNQKDYFLIKKWKAQTKAKIQLARPDLSDEFLEDYLNKVIDKNFKDHECVLDNNYNKKCARTSLLNVVEYIHETKPIVAGNGVLYRNQYDAPNPAAGMLKESMDNRKLIKAERKKYDEDSYEFLMKDIGQGNEKVIANSYYGAGGAKTSVFYNLYVAASVTGTGQALISTSETSFESLCSNNTKFYDMDECLLFIYRVIYKTDYSSDCVVNIIPNAFEKAYQKICDSFLWERTINHEMLKNILSRLSPEDLTKLYYKNNLVAFLTDSPSVAKILTHLVNDTKSFRDPNNVPDEIKDDLETLWKYCLDWVAHNFPVRNRIERDKSHMRKTVVTQDTDSTMTTIKNIIDTLIEVYAKDEVAAENDSEFDFILVNISCYLLTRWTHVFLERYCSDVNIPKEFHHMINMKNEFYFPKMLLTSTKKRYVCLMKLQEGKEISPPKVKVSGLDFVKAETSDKTKEFFTNILETQIMKADNINVSRIFKSIRDFGDTIKASIKSGNVEYLPLKSAKVPDAYDEPFSEQSIRATLAWNFAYPSMQINLPDKILMVKIDAKKPKQFEAMKDLIPADIYEKLDKNIFNNRNDKISRQGLTVIALPQNVGKIPQWIIDIADIGSIVDDNVSKFNPVLKSLGNINLNTRANTPHMSNIIDL